MAKTASAAKQARAGARRQINNKSIKSRLRTLETKYLALVTDKKGADAEAAFRLLTAALDKAAKTKVLHRNTANRKKSRLAARLASIAKAA